MPTIRKKREDLPPISKKRIEALKAIPDEKIDFSDIPELDEEFWENAEWVEPDKTLPLTIRVKESVLDYFKAGGKGYQTRINAVLESYVRAKKELNPSQLSHRWNVIKGSCRRAANIEPPARRRRSKSSTLGSKAGPFKLTCLLSIIFTSYNDYSIFRPDF